MANCCANLDDLKKQCGPNMGEIKKILIACSDEIDSIPDPTDHVIDGDIVVVEPTTDGFHEWEFVPDRSMTAETQGDPYNRSYNYSVSGFIAKATGAKSNILNDTIGGDFIIVAIDGNGTRWLLGDLDEGATVDVVQRADDKNGYDVTIQYAAAHLLYEVTGAVPLAPAA